MKKVCFILALGMVALLAGCGDSESSEPKQPVSSTASSAATSGAQSNPIEDVREKTESVTIEEQVLLDEDGIKVTATGIESGLFGTDIKVLVENNGEKTKVVQAEYTTVNGYMITNLFSSEVAPGKKSNDTITLAQSDIEACGITTIADVGVSLIVIDSESWERDITTDLIQIKTSAFDGFVYEYDDSGEVLYDENGIRIITAGLVEGQSLFGDDLLLYIENLTDKTIIVQAEDLSVNGFMMDALFSETILSGKRSNTELSIMDYSKEENGITEISEMEISLIIIDEGSWEHIAETEPIVLNFN